MNIKLILTLTLTALTANAYAADGYDRTGSATYTAGYGAPAGSAEDDRADSTKVASEGDDHTDAARTN